MNFLRWPFVNLGIGTSALEVAYEPQTYQGDDLGWGNPTHKFMRHMNHVVTR